MPLKKILNAEQISSIISRLAFQLIEEHNDFSNTVILAIQPRGVLLAKRILEILIEQSYKVDLGVLDITFFRDDFRRNEKSLKANKTNINFSLTHCTDIILNIS